MSTLSVARGNASLPQDVAYLEKHDPARNMQRYYRVSVTPALFGEFAMVREWGRIGRRGGSRMESWFASEEDARRSGQEMAEAKHRRGYRPLAAAGH
ncbi:MAG: WGR domain-containing protein [Rhodospirillales bacterium]|nr:WGR domain-containing protein [Rhodospirillales bacterium]